jgi:hypothetical protein
MHEEYQLKDYGGAPPHELQDALERSEVVYFARCPVELPASEDLTLLREGLPTEMRIKNLSYHPESDSVPGFEAEQQLKDRVEGILRTHGRRVEAFLRTALPDFAPNWTLGTTSFRASEEQGRKLKPRSSNERVHIDAGAYGATNGARILRFFVNVHPSRERIWGTKGSFNECMSNYDELWTAARGKQPEVSLGRSPLDRMYSGLIATVGRVYPLIKVIDSSPYDRTMRRIHNRMKESETFRGNEADYREIHFPPMSSWMVFTDGISHSVLTGQYALVTTALVPLENCRHPELAPYNVLARAAGQASPPR